MERSLLSFLILLIGWNHITGIFNFNTGEINQDGIEIVSFNLQGSSYTFEKDKDIRKEKEHDYTKFLASFKPLDILCVYEMSHKSKKLLLQAFDFKEEVLFEAKSIGIFSNFPIVDKGLIDFGNRSNNAIWADMVIQSDTVRVYAVHFESNHISLETEQVFDASEINQRDMMRNIKTIFGRYGSHAVKRYHQLETLIAHKNNSPYPVIICGDFNETPQSHLYHRLKSGMKDSFREEGSGIGTTYAGQMPGLRIDYILADESFEILDHQIFKGKFSDHYPIKSTVN